MIGNNTVLGFFEAIVDDNELQKLITKFWSSIDSDPEYFRNVVKDKENNEIRYNSVEPHTLGQEVHDEITVVKLGDYISKILDKQTKKALNEIDEYIESNSKNEVKPFLRLQYQKLTTIEDEISDSRIQELLPTFQTTIQRIKEKVVDYSQIYEMTLQLSSSSSNVGRPPLKSDEYFVEQINKVLSEAKNDNPSNDYFHCIHRNGKFAEQPNYREIARKLFDDEPDLNELYSSDEGLQKRVKKIIETYELF